MPRVLVLGGTGMLGHVLWRTCADRGDAYATIRDAHPPAAASPALDPARTIGSVRAEDPASVRRALVESRAAVVVNCIGIVKQSPLAADSVEMVRVNALFPHELARLCAELGVRLICISTDCVFSGARGGYAEDDLPDPVDRYGLSKLLGEPEGPGVLTLRTSMIGRELTGTNGLLEWFLSQAGPVRGFTRARFSGPTAPVLARLIADLIADHPDLEGTWHVGAEPIAKHDLLQMLRDAMAPGIEVVADESVSIDRSLDSSRLREETGWLAPSWSEMVAELAAATESGVEAKGPGLARR
jgi:dTDP-4-dehydrorhamnose reductase